MAEPTASNFYAAKSLPSDIKALFLSVKVTLNDGQVQGQEGYWNAQVWFLQFFLKSY